MMSPSSSVCLYFALSMVLSCLIFPGRRQRPCAPHAIHDTIMASSLTRCRWVSRTQLSSLARRNASSRSQGGHVATVSQSIILVGRDATVRWYSRERVPGAAPAEWPMTSERWTMAADDAAVSGASGCDALRSGVRTSQVEQCEAEMR